MRILIVEDELLLAMEIEQIVVEMGHEAIGIAADSTQAMHHAGKAEVALVDLDLRDGPTGKETGRALANEHGVTVVYMTANPSQLRNGVPGTIGVVSKPALGSEVQQAVAYAVALRRHRAVRPPRGLRLFSSHGATFAAA